MSAVKAGLGKRSCAEEMLVAMVTCVAVSCWLCIVADVAFQPHRKARTQEPDGSTRELLSLSLSGSPSLRSISRSLLDFAVRFRHPIPSLFSFSFFVDRIPAYSSHPVESSSVVEQQCFRLGRYSAVVVFVNRLEQGKRTKDVFYLGRRGPSWAPCCCGRWIIKGEIRDN